VEDGWGATERRSVGQTEPEGKRVPW